MRRTIYIDCATPEVRIAIVEDGVLAELHVERPSSRGVGGNIYKGRVNTVLPGMQAAFVGVGLDRDAFLYVEDALPEVADGDEAADGADGEEADAEADEAGGRESPAGDAPAAAPEAQGDQGGEAHPPPEAAGRPRAADRPGRRRGGRGHAAAPPIADLVRVGQDLAVQIVRDPVARKGARVTTRIALPGRGVVYVPGGVRIGVSRRIADPAERARLHDLAAEVLREAGVPGGCIVRTAAVGMSREAIAADIGDLATLWRAIASRGETAAPPALLHEEPGVVARVLRDVGAEDVERVLIEGEAAWREVVARARAEQPALVPKIWPYTGAAPIFDEFGLETQLERALRPRVWLKSGGSIVIHQTEALVAVDVNTAKFVGSRTLEDTIVQINLEAAREIVRQMRLRDLGGIIVVDFIDMDEAAGREALVRVLEEELGKDKAKSRMQPLSGFGLVEITRQRARRGLERVLCEPCAACGGAGRVKSAETVRFEVLRAVRRLRARPPARAAVRVHPEVAERLRRSPEDIEAAKGGAAIEVTIESDAAMPAARFTIATSGF